MTKKIKFNTKKAKRVFGENTRKLYEEWKALNETPKTGLTPEERLDLLEKRMDKFDELMADMECQVAKLENAPTQYLEDFG